MRETLVFSVALNGYQWRYQKLLNSHREYAASRGYDHIAITRPSFSLLGMEVAWLKVRVIIEALRAGYQNILFLDADTRIKHDAPPIEHCYSEDYCIYAAKGFSGRYNSGVILIRNTNESLDFFSRLLRIATRPVPEEDSVGWGENGHFIYLANRNSNVGELDSRWNNNHTPQLIDYVRHYSHGPLFNAFYSEKEYRPTCLDYLLYRICHYSLAILKRASKLTDPFYPPESLGHCFHRKLEQLAEKVFAKYPNVFLRDASKAN